MQCYNTESYDVAIAFFIPHVRSRTRECAAWSSTILGGSNGGPCTSGYPRPRWGTLSIDLPVARSSSRSKVNKFSTRTHRFVDDFRGNKHLLYRTGHKLDNNNSGNRAFMVACFACVFEQAFLSTLKTAKSPIFLSFCGISHVHSEPKCFGVGLIPVTASFVCLPQRLVDSGSNPPTQHFFKLRRMC